MRAVSKDMMEMKVTELKEELGARDEPVSGNKAWLRRRLHAAIVSEHLGRHSHWRRRTATFSGRLAWSTLLAF